jgi:hypothetical protein
VIARGVLGERGRDARTVVLGPAGGEIDVVLSAWR